MADTIRKMLDITGTLFADGQVAKSLSPQRFRDVMETFKTQYYVSHIAASGAFTTAGAATWKSIDRTDVVIASNGFTGDLSGSYQYDDPPVDSVTLVNGVRNFICLGFASVSALTADQVGEFGFAKDGTIVDNTRASAFLEFTGTERVNVTFGGMIVGLANGEAITAQYKNDTGDNLTIDSLTTIIIGIND